jgi:type II secretory pathway component GspD/PulD (secretin)
VKRLIDQFTKESAKAGERTSQVYRLEWADPRAAYSVLASLVPTAQIALDAASHNLVVSAMPEDHAKIKETIDEMDRRDGKGGSPRLEVHRLQTTDVTNLLPVLQGLFRSHPEVQLSIDEQNDAIVALASPSQHDTIRSLIAKVEQEAASDSAVRLQMFPLKDLQATSTLRTITALVEKQGAKAELSIEPRSNSLVAIARPEQLKSIDAALKQITPEERTLEVIQLEVVEPLTAEMAIERLFSEGTYYHSPHAPSVESDPATQQLIVRATKDQHQKIRDLLIKLGETSLAHSPDGRRSRVVAFDGDLPVAIDEIKRVWPTLRNNPIHVMTPPSDVIIRQRPPANKADDKAVKKPAEKSTQILRSPRNPDATKNGTQKSPGLMCIAPEIVPPDDASGSAKKKETGVEPAKPNAAKKAGPPSPAPAAPQVAKPQAAKPQEPAWRASQHKKANAEPEQAAKTWHAVGKTRPAAKAEPPAIASPGEKKPGEIASSTEPGKPIIVTPGDGSVTISSDDPAALAQFEELLRGLSRQKGAVGRNYNVFLLRNAKASAVAVTMQNLFRQMGNRYGGTQVVIVPDDRLNAIVAYANRTDRTTIENLLKVLDTPDVPESFGADRMHLIAVKNADADTMVHTVQTLFRGQIDGISVEETTNSLIVMAGPSAAEEVQRVVEVLDRAAGSESSRSIHIVPLKKTSTERVEQALDIIFKQKPARAPARTNRHR